MIVLNNATVALPPASPNATTILHSVSLRIQRGEWVALLGPNGSGKTTLLHAIAGLTNLSSGEISFVPGTSARGAKTARASDKAAAFRPVTALLLQEPDNQFVTASARHELELSVPPGQEDRRVVSGRIEAAVDRFALGKFLDRNPHRISGGEKQRLALATVWLQEPELLLLDEPTAYLDREAAAECVAFLREMHHNGVTIVWATPGGEELTYAGTIVCIDGGKIEFCGETERFYEWPGEARFEYISPPARRLATSVLRGVQKAASGDGDPGAVAGPETGGTGVAALAETLAGLLSADGPVTIGDGRGARYTSAGNGESVLSFSSVTFRYGDVDAIRDLDLTVYSGECLGVTGPNGAGKTTLLELAGGVYEPASGTLRRKYRRIVANGRQNVFYLFQSPERLFFAETVLEEITFGLRHAGVPPEACERRATSALESVGLEPEQFLLRSPFSLSLGEMRRVAFAVTLALEPRLLLLDEPTSCLDQAGRTALNGLLSRYRAEGRTVVVASNETSFLAEVCDRIVWLRDGGVDAVVDTSGAELEAGVAWPERTLLPILELQDALAARGVSVVPRALTPAKLIERLNRR